MYEVVDDRGQKAARPMGIQESIKGKKAARRQKSRGPGGAGGHCKMCVNHAKWRTENGEIEGKEDKCE